mmetsp:Transcript_32936/g.74709  ORF Transcript_32936/g.74709 Transcript_32936/m.74709 type:complete len:131 (-) Transcript_32936:486-878(-)
MSFSFTSFLFRLLPPSGREASERGRACPDRCEEGDEGDEPSAGNDEREEPANDGWDEDLLTSPVDLLACMEAGGGSCRLSFHSSAPTRQRMLLTRGREEPPLGTSAACNFGMAAAEIASSRVSCMNFRVE